MLRTCLVLGGLILSGSAFAAPLSEFGKEGVATFCAATWRTDSKMREHCVAQQTDAAQKVLIIGEFLLADEKHILVMCMRAGQKEFLKIYDWQIVDYCLGANILATKN